MGEIALILANQIEITVANNEETQKRPSDKKMCEANDGEV